MTRNAARVLPLRQVGPSPDRLAQAVNLDRLIVLGWDRDSEVLTPPPAHLLLGWQICPVARCGGEGRRSDGLCVTCALAWRTEVVVDLAAFCAQGVDPARRTAPGLCLVCHTPGFQRPVSAKDLCISCNHLRGVRQQSIQAYVAGDDRFPAAVARPGLGQCPARTCGRLAAHRNGLCDAHYQLWRTAGFPPFDGFLREGTPRHGDLTGRVVMAGLPARVITELLFGIQACLAAGGKLRPPALRAAVKHLRDSGVATIADLDVAGLSDPPRRFLSSTVSSLQLLVADPDSEHPKDVWDLRVWGHAGRLSFVGGLALHLSRGEPARPVTQGWLKEAVKAWTADALVSQSSARARQMVTAVGLFSEHLARRPDRGEDPDSLGRRDLESFLARLGHLQATGTMSADRRVRTIRTLGKFFRDCRAMGLTRPGAAMSGLGEDLIIRPKDVPAERICEPDDVGLALPEVVMDQLLNGLSLALLELLSGPGVRAALELQAGVGRRTGELCSLALNCLDHDERVGEDGALRRAPVLVHDMPKVDKVGCRLPINQREAEIISDQQARVRAQFPDTDPARLVLFPRPTKNPDGTWPIAPAQFQRAIQVWVGSLPSLDGLGHDSTGRPVPFPRQRVFPYAFRHTFAQRHADAGTPVDTLKELLGHKRIHTTLGYYRVTAKRKRDAQDRLGPLQIDAGGLRVRPDLATLTDAEATRDQIGQVAVPFGTCTEPSNVAADGHSCPFRHRCTGCTYFRTDPSYTPELQSYLAQLLADRERLATALPALADWARRDAAPSDDEIEAVRRLLRSNDEVLTGIDDDDRTAVEAAITLIRTQRAQLAVSFPAELAGVVRQPTPVFFPTIERAHHTPLQHG